MSFLSRWFRKQSNDEDYEEVLSNLARDIKKRQAMLSEIRLRERRSTLLTILYTFALWGAYVGLWYMNILPNFSGPQRGNKVRKAVASAPVIIGPIIILFVGRIVQMWYKNKGDTEEKMIQTLLKQQRGKVEEIKKKTNYYSTRTLIERYDDPSASPLLRRVGPSNAHPLPPATPQRILPQPNPNFQTPNVPGALKTPSGPPTQFSLSMPAQSQPFPAPRRQWYDKLVDALLGDDEQAPNAASSRYALICEKCFTHNGLVKESMWEDAQYICLKCGHFNASARDKKQGVSSPLPSSLFSLPRTTPPSGYQPRPPSSPRTSASDQPSIIPPNPTTEPVNSETGEDTVEALASPEHENVEGDGRMEVDS